MESIAAILSSISIANIIVLGILIIIFTRAYLYTKANLPLAMLTFSGLLLLHNVIGADAYFASQDLFSQELFPYMVGIHSTELVGLLIFLKVAWQ